MPSGLPPAARFRQIREDLETLRAAFGGELPEGLRNTWLHLYATSLTHDASPVNIAVEIAAAARLATPDLPATEVAAIIRTAERQSTATAGPGVLRDGRYHYSGAQIADLLGVSAADAQRLGLRQIMPAAARQQRKSAAERARRRRRGVMLRAQWCAENSASRTELWKRYGLSRSTYYARRKAGTLPDLTTG